jgi:hypothetical protein
MTTKVPVRLQVYHGRFGHWEREGLRKYKGRCFYLWCMLADHRPRVPRSVAHIASCCTDWPDVCVGLDRSR